MNRSLPKPYLHKHPTPIMQGITNLHHDVFFFVILILVFVSWILGRALWHFHYKKNPIPQRIVHGANLLIHIHVKPLQPILHTNHPPLKVMAKVSMDSALWKNSVVGNSVCSVTPGTLASPSKWLILSLPDQNFLFPGANLSNLINLEKLVARKEARRKRSCLRSFGEPPGGVVRSGFSTPRPNKRLRNKQKGACRTHEGQK